MGEKKRFGSWREEGAYIGTGENWGGIWPCNQYTAGWVRRGSQLESTK